MVLITSFPTMTAAENRHAAIVFANATRAIVRFTTRERRMILTGALERKAAPIIVLPR